MQSCYEVTRNPREKGAFFRSSFMGIMRSKQQTTSATSKEEKKKNPSMGRRISLKSLKQEYKLEPSRSFIVRFAGKIETSNPGGENVDECLHKLYKKVRDNLNGLPRVCLEISCADVKIRWMKAGTDNHEEIEVPFSRISFVVADKKHQLFAFNDFVSQKPRKVECYAFICNESEKSDVVANALSEAFKSVHDRPRRRSSLSEKEGGN